MHFNSDTFRAASTFADACAEQQFLARAAELDAALAQILPSADASDPRPES